MATFEEVLKSLAEEDRAALARVLDNWGLDSRRAKLVLNIRKERFLPSPCFHAIQLVLVNSAGTLVESLYQSECFKHARRGGPIQVQPEMVGRATELAQLRAELMHTAGDPLFNNEQVVDEFLKDLFSQSEASRESLQRLRQLTIPLFKPTAWVTWDLDTSHDPFKFAVNADAVRDLLGLDQRLVGRGEELALFVYPVNDLVLSRPTIADAALNQQFEPPTLEERFGITRPLTDGKVGRPEAVHGKISFSVMDHTRSRRIQ